jgi:hypothetical protein
MIALLGGLIVGYQDGCGATSPTKKGLVGAGLIADLRERHVNPHYGSDTAELPKSIMPSRG